MNKQLLAEFAGYAAASALALAVDVGILVALVQNAHAHYLVAVVVAYLSGAVVAYFLSTRYVFATRRVRNRLSEFVAFTAIGLVGLAINAVVVYLIVAKMAQNYLVGKGCAVALSFAASFVLRKLTLFSPATSARDAVLGAGVRAGQKGCA